MSLSLHANPILPEFYGEEYFAGKGSAVHGGYTIPEWDRWSDVLGVLCEILSIPRQSKLLDIGCGTGALLKYAIPLGLDACGFDFSPWAIQNPTPGAPSERMSCQDVRDEINGHWHLGICASVLEHIPITDIPLVLDNVRRHVQWLVLKVDTIEILWPEAASIDKDRFRYTFLNESPPENDLQQALLDSGHVTTLPSREWCDLFSAHLKMERCHDKEDAFWLRLINRIDWSPDSFFIFCQPGSNRPRAIIWAVDSQLLSPRGPITNSMIHERWHCGHVVGSFSSENVRDQQSAWNQIDVRPDFIVHRDHVAAIKARWPWSADFVVVEEGDYPLPPGIFKVNAGDFLRMRPSWRY
jgi:SAM-dependent methyltransferase